jgi:hypothetical protein
MLSAKAWTELLEARRDPFSKGNLAGYIAGF